MKVKFRRNWMPPASSGLGRIRARDGVQDIPDSLRPYLPSTAEIGGKDEKPAPKLTLKDHDHARAAVIAEQRVHEAVSGADQGAALMERASKEG